MGCLRSEGEWEKFIKEILEENLLKSRPCLQIERVDRLSPSMTRTRVHHKALHCETSKPLARKRTF